MPLPEICLLRTSLVVQILAQPLIKVMSSSLKRLSPGSAAGALLPVQQQLQVGSAALALAFSPTGATSAPARQRASPSRGAKCEKSIRKSSLTLVFSSHWLQLGVQGASDQVYHVEQCLLVPYPCFFLFTIFISSDIQFQHPLVCQPVDHSGLEWVEVPLGGWGDPRGWLTGASGIHALIPLMRKIL